MGSQGVPLEMFILSICWIPFLGPSLWSLRAGGELALEGCVCQNNRHNLARVCALLRISENDAPDKQKSLAFVAKLG
jgi:hypothetical protein